MRLGEIKAQALKLMLVTDTEEIRAADIERISDDDVYRPYLLGMIGAINRCLSDIEQRRVLPVCQRGLLPEEATRGRSTLRFALSGVADFFDVCRIVAEGDYTYDGDAPYYMEGKTLVLRGMDGDVDYTLLYYPRLCRLSEDADNEAELAGVPEEIACLIPYFIKGDLYREDEPNEAGEARNWYESGMAALERGRTEKQGRVATVYSQVDE